MAEAINRSRTGPPRFEKAEIEHVGLAVLRTD
jgi:hypothetical protein